MFQAVTGRDIISSVELSLTMSMLGPIYRGMKQSLKIYQTNEINEMKVVCTFIIISLTFLSWKYPAINREKRTNISHKSDVLFKIIILVISYYEFQN